MKKLFFFVFYLLISTCYAEELGSVDTAWKLIGNNNQIIIEVFDDPKVQV